MAIIATYTQQPADRIDYDIPYDLESTDSIASVTATVSPSGLTVTATNNSPRVKLWVSGGTSGTTYKIEVTVTTTIGRIKQDELKIRCKEV